MRTGAVILLATVAVTAIPGEPSTLTKLVLTFSRPGAFNKTHSVFGGKFDTPPDVTPCPLGPEGLGCRQAEARRVIENCPGGVCDSCGESCYETHASTWPHCCQHNNLCCSELARACQTCKVAGLQPFCNKHFKRCF